MSKMNEATGFLTEAFQANSDDQLATPSDRSNASVWLGVVISEMRRSLKATSTHADLIHRSDRGLADIGLSRGGIPDHIFRRYYAD
jgi:hypothetical protein